MKKHVIPTMYDCYPMYSALLGGNPGQRAIDTTAYAMMIHDLQIKRGQPLNKLIQVLELFSGNNEQKEPLLRACESVGVTDVIYAGLDLFAPHCDIKADALEWQPDPDRRFDVTIAGFSSVESTVCDVGGVITRAKVMELLENAHNMSGVLILDYSANPIYPGREFPPLSELCVQLHSAYHEDMFVYAKLKPGPGYTLRSTANVQYNRATGCIEYHIVDLIIQDGLGRTRWQATVDQPVHFRYWSESEMVDMCTEAGWNVTFYNTTTATDVAQWYTPLEDTDSGEILLANKLLLWNATSGIK